MKPTPQRTRLRQQARSVSVVPALVATILGAMLAVAGLAEAATTSTAPSKKTSRYLAKPMPESARNYYAVYWGIDQLSAKLMESGALIRFNYRIVDATKAQALQDKAASPSMIDEKARVSLVVPTLEKVGPLRQAMAVENGKTYWMAFSNKGGMVKAGHRVSVVIGPVRIDGLVVE